MTLKQYKGKRKLSQTLEPSAKFLKKHSQLSFVVQEHHASHLHYDLRLEVNGVLKSWAIPKGPSMNPKDKRLAIMVEDHPYEYKDFKGVIPKGHYGAGRVLIFDHGYYATKDATVKQLNEHFSRELERGHLTFILYGTKLRGEFSLVKLAKGEKNEWLLIKKNDVYATDKNILVNDNTSLESNIVNCLQQIPDSTMPMRIKPMLAHKISKPFNGTGWIFEIKWDGYRIIAYVNNNEVKLLSRNQKDYTKIFLPVTAELASMNIRAVFDGEMIVADRSGHPDFQKIQRYQDTQQGHLLYYVFDLLWIEGKDLRKLSLVQRKDLLKKFLPKLNYIKISDYIANRGKEFFKLATRQHVEGIMAKNLVSDYQEGQRSHDWLKIKAIQRQEFVIAGYTAPRGSRHYFGALILGVYEENTLIYVGHVGTGFDESSLASLRQRFDRLTQTNCPLTTLPHINAGVTWIKPVLVCEIVFSEWTRDHMLRHPVFKGLREDKAADLVHLEKNIALPVVHPNNNEREKILVINRRRLTLTHLNKLYWPDEKYTKGDLIEYYRTVAAIMLPYIKHKPQSLHRFPDGIFGEDFFQKNITSAPDWVLTQVLHSESENKNIRYIICDNLATLIYMVNLGCIEINPWLSRVKKLDNPDYCVFDLDPENIPFTAVVKTARAIHRLLDKIGAANFCKTSGASGLHIYVPLKAKYNYEQARLFVHLIAGIINDELPDITSLERSPKKRKGRVYIDYLQNRRGQTIAAPYSVRPLPHAPVSTPLQWREVTNTLNPVKFTIKTIVLRLNKLGDIWQDMLQKPVNLENCIDKLSKLKKDKV